VLAIDSLPRTLSRAQKMDALTSQAGVAGYRAVIEAANAFGRFFNGQITAAGKVPPAKVFIAGAGVAGLAAIGTAANLGAIVRANDTRAEVADQVASLGGEFVKVDYEEEGSGGGGYAKVMSEGFQKAQREMYAKQAREVDIIITTALIPGKPAPRLITAEMVQLMKAGQRHRRHGGRAGRQLRADRAGPGRGQARRHHHRLHRPGQPPGEAVVDAVRHQPVPPRRGTVQDQGRHHRRQHGRRSHPRPDGNQGRQHHLAAAGTESCRPHQPRHPPRPPPVPAAKKSHGHGKGSAPASSTAVGLLFAAGALIFWFIGAGAPAAFLGHFTVFVLACFVGYMVVWNVTPALHTPLMSVTNAISSIIAIGALVQIAPPTGGGGLAVPTTGFAGWRSVPSFWRRSTCSAASP
jgi:NAD(P) transhydrogenase subunit alpha